MCLLVMWIPEIRIRGDVLARRSMRRAAVRGVVRALLRAVAGTVISVVVRSMTRAVTCILFPMLSINAVSRGVC